MSVDFNAEQFKDKYPRAVKAIQKNHYVDDFIDSDQEEIKLAKQMRLIHSAAGFYIRNRASNSCFLDAIT